jgi:hypothetical protein
VSAKAKALKAHKNSKHDTNEIPLRMPHLLFPAILRPKVVLSKIKPKKGIQCRTGL